MITSFLGNLLIAALISGSLKDYGKEVFKKAITASSKHAAYYAALGRGRLAYVEKIVEEYSTRE